MADQPATTRPIALAVDDEPIVRAVAVDMLDELGFLVLVADDGLQALDVLRARPDVMLLVADCRMPGMDGPTLADEATRLRPSLSVVFVTGYPAPRSAKWPVVHKLYPLCDLAHAVRRARPRPRLVI
jgi:CheY-like chemotaxis protein